jgi:DNA-directed RNA polymerase specialized sigma24 family protein
MNRLRPTGSGLQILLHRLGPDSSSAGREYEKLRARLHKLFEINRCADPDGMVDRVFERVERKLEEVDRNPQDNEAVRNLFAFVSGVARNLLRESWVSPESRVEPIDPNLHDRRDPIDDDEEAETKEQRLVCLEACLSGLPSKVRRQMLDYHSGQGRQGIDARKRIAEEEEISVENLRVKMLRVRREIEKCILACLKKEK